MSIIAISNNRVLTCVFQLPDFLAALHGDTTDVSSSRNTTPQMSRSSSRASGPSNSLKYAAYAPPEAVPRLSTRRRSLSQQSASGSHSGTTSDASRHRVQRLPTPLPITAGHLALADNLSSLHISQVERNSPSESKQSWQREAEVRGTPKASQLVCTHSFKGPPCRPDYPGVTLPDGDFHGIDFV